MLKKLGLATLLLTVMSFAPSVIASPPPERCPNIDRAIQAIEAAEHDMQIANHDFRGHKADAMEAACHVNDRLANRVSTERPSSDNWSSLTGGAMFRGLTLVGLICLALLPTVKTVKAKSRKKHERCNKLRK